MVAFCSSDKVVGLFLSCFFSYVSGYDSPEGYISSLGDVNGDKSIDVITLSYGHVMTEFNVSLAFWNRGNSHYDVSTVLKSRDWSDGVITGSQLVDFNSDGHLDLLLQSQSLDSGIFSGTVLWGNGSGFTTPSYSISSDWCSEHLVADMNGDEIPDVVAKECGSSSLKVWISNGYMRNFTLDPLEQYVKTTGCLSDVSMSSNVHLAFVDINGDLMADLVAVYHTNASLSIKVEAFIRQSSNENWQCCPLANFQSSIVPHPSFADFDANGATDILLPICSQPDCSDARILVLFNTWSSQGCPWIDNLDINISQVVGQESRVSFAPIPIIPSPQPDVVIPTWIRVGDYDLDTYPDVVVVATVTTSDQSGYEALLLINTGCPSSLDCGHGRTLNRRSINGLDSKDSAKLGLFHDVDEDGDLDILLSVATTEEQSTHTHLLILTNKLDSDANFLRVDVMTAACVGEPGECQEHPGYGVSQLGATVDFSTTGPYGDKVRSTSGQLSKSGSFSCSLPYVVFGLSRSSTFIEHLSVGIPYVRGSGRVSRRWSSLIPNSHLYIIPQPSNDPSSWRNILLVNPSDKVWYTLAVFASTCAVFGVIVGLLQWREKRQDEREKRQQAHKFHFDAM